MPHVHRRVHMSPSPRPRNHDFWSILRSPTSSESQIAFNRRRREKYSIQAIAENQTYTPSLTSIQTQAIRLCTPLRENIKETIRGDIPFRKCRWGAREPILPLSQPIPPSRCAIECRWIDQEEARPSVQSRHRSARGCSASSTIRPRRGYLYGRRDHSPSYSLR